MQEQRKHPRKVIEQDLSVTDVNSGNVLGRLVNLSVGGMMLYAGNRIANLSVFQVSFDLPDGEDASGPLQLGIECLWCSASDRPNGFWVGFHIIDIAEEHRERLVQFTS
jgi:hypothetical protein